MHANKHYTQSTAQAISNELWLNLKHINPIAPMSIYSFMGGNTLPAMNPD